jgi:hypothetical protein
VKYEDGHLEVELPRNSRDAVPQTGEDRSKGSQEVL